MRSNMNFPLMIWETPEKRKKFLIIIVLAGIFLALFYYFVIYPVIQPAAFSSHYSYDLTIETNLPLYNVTFIVPLPIQNGSPKVGTLLLNEDMFKKEGYKVSFVLVEGIPSIKISTATILPGRENRFRVDIGDGQETTGLPYLVNTIIPLGNESVFLPKYNISIRQPQPASYSTSHGIHYYPLISSYQTKVYAEYSTSPNTVVQLISHTDGLNSWVELDSWLQNKYGDDFSISLNGMANGWYMASGELKSGEGIYLDR